MDEGRASGAVCRVVAGEAELSVVVQRALRARVAKLAVELGVDLRGVHTLEACVRPLEVRLRRQVQDGCLLVRVDALELELAVYPVWGVGLGPVSASTYEDLWVRVVCVAEGLGYDVGGLPLLQRVAQLEIQITGQVWGGCVFDRVGRLEVELGFVPPV